MKFEVHVMNICKHRTRTFLSRIFQQAPFQLIHHRVLDEYRYLIDFELITFVAICVLVVLTLQVLFQRSRSDVRSPRVAGVSKDAPIFKGVRVFDVA